jgi:hypothetical protein
MDRQKKEGILGRGKKSTKIEGAKHRKLRTFQYFDVPHTNTIWESKRECLSKTGVLESLHVISRSFR